MKQPSQIVEKIEECLSQKNDQELQSEVEKLNAGDLADIINSLERGKKKFFRMIESKKAGQVLFLLNRYSLNRILKNISRTRLRHLFGHLSTDEEADVVEMMPENRTDEALKEIPVEDKKEVQELLKYPEDSAGSLIQKKILKIQKNATVNDAIQNIKKLINEGEENIHNLFVTDEEQKLVGIIPLRKLLLVKPEAKVDSIMKKNPLSISVETDQEKVASIFKENDLVSLPVVDSKNILLGRIMVDDVMDVVNEENTEDMFKMAGISKEDHVLDPASVSIKRRLPWLMINLATALLAASVVGLFQDTIQKFVLLAVYMPIVAGMGGNAGTQVITVIVRGIALDEIKFVKVRKLLFKEIFAGLGNGLAVGFVIGIAAYLFNGSYMLGVVIFLAMIINLTIAGIFGTLVPLTLKYVKLDPALASSVFVTTSTDLFGFLAFLGLASVMMT
jgi:magnesium transporter